MIVVRAIAAGIGCNAQWRAVRSPDALWVEILTAPGRRDGPAVMGDECSQGIQVAGDGRAALLPRSPDAGSPGRPSGRRTGYGRRSSGARLSSLPAGRADRLLARARPAATPAASPSR